MIRNLLNRLKKRVPTDIAPESVAPERAENLGTVIDDCGTYIVRALEDIAQMNSISACKNHREAAGAFSMVKRVYRKSRSGNSEILITYLNYMVEATEKIAETVRHIVTDPEASIPISTKCELLTMRDTFSQLKEDYIRFENEDKDANRLLSAISNENSFIKHLIDTHSKTMTHADYEDESISYSYLMLLYYLHSYINSFEKVIKIVSKS